MGVKGEQMPNHYEVHVISNTHWDREWLYNFQETRLMLVEMMDCLLDILDTEPDYKSFVLDSQTVPLEDYLEIRPQNFKRIKKHVQDGRLLIGPWYTDPESFSVNGESLARNLLMGHRVAKSFGKVMKVGYTPFGYGQNSQMPQLYQNFGIDTMLFYHGVSHDEVKNEFIFEGADGSQVLGSQLSSGARYNFYHNVYRPVIHGKGIKERTYNWQEGGLPFHPALPKQALAHHSVLNPTTQFDEKSLETSVKSLFESEKGVATTKYLTFMSGHDSSIPDKAELKLIESAKIFLDEADIFHSSLSELMEKIKNEAKDLTVLKGERRTPKLMNGRVHLYSDVLSSRIKMKLQNARAEYNLQRMAEPYAALNWLLGNEYPAKQLEFAWKTLLKCHAHDSLAGSGVDDIEMDMMYRLRQVNNICDSLFRRSLENIQLKIDVSDLDDDAIIITVYNPSPFSRSEVVSAVLDIPVEKTSQNFSLTKVNGSELVPVQLASRKPHHSVMNQPGEAALMMECEQTVIHFLAKNIPAMGYTTYFLNQNEPFARGNLVCSYNAMENDHLHVQIERDGTLTVKNKMTNRIYDKLHYFEDGGEAGHAWMHIEPSIDKVITTLGQAALISLVEEGPLKASYRIEYVMEIPDGIEENGGDKWQRLDGAGGSAKRSERTVQMKINSTITLKKDSPVIEVRMEFDNIAENHRLRVMFPSLLTKAKICNAETAFDVIEREIELTSENPWYGGENATFPMQRFVDVNDGENGLALINNGLREYQVIDDDERTIALTLLRAYEINLTTVSWRWESHPEMKLSQSPGKHIFEYMIYPHQGDWISAQVHQIAEQLSVPLLPVQAGTNKGTLPAEYSFMEIEQPELVLSAVKLSEDKDALVIRVYNPTLKPVNGKINFYKTIESVQLVTMEEKPLKDLKIEDKSLSLLVDKKKVVTLKIKFVE
jgi:alpha-mannosidase